MGDISFEKTFGNQAKAATAVKEDRPKANLWLNIGYSVEVDTAEGVEQRFVSLPVGIPLDTMEPLPTNSRNADFAAFQAARNNLHEQIMAAAQALQPGEEKILNLQIQLRRVNEESVAVDSSKNQFIKPLAL